MKSRPFVITFALLSLIGAGAMESSVTKRLRFAYWERPATEITLGIPEGVSSRRHVTRARPPSPCCANSRPPRTPNPKT